MAREFTAYPEIEEIDVVEPDEQFVEVCKEYFPEAAKGFEDSRVQVFYQDGLRFLRGRSDEYDIIINDATDPFGHTEGLFTKEFYGSCYKALKADGIMGLTSTAAPSSTRMSRPSAPCTTRSTGPSPSPASIRPHIPTCTSGYWMFGFASKKYHPIEDFDPVRWNARGLKTEYYTTNLHIGAFMLPKYVEDILEQERGMPKHG